MRKKNFVFLIFIILFQPSLMAQVKCIENKTGSTNAQIEKLSSYIAIVAEKTSDNNNVKLEAAKTYLMSIGDIANLNENETNNFISSITPICENNKLDPHFRSKVCNTLSSLHGKMTTKLGTKGISNGKSAFNYTKLSLSLDPNNIDAIIGHASAVVAIYNQGFVIRKIAAMNLHTNFGDEAKYAKANLERVNQTGGPIYKEILDLL